MLAEILQYIGYIASAIIALSMTLNSIVKFRWINLLGASTFAVYGFFINAIPVGLLNTFIASVDIYFILKIYSKEEYFHTLEIRANNNYLLAFLKFYEKEIQQIFPEFTYKPELNTVSFLILRNMNVAGVFLAHTEGENIIKVGLDFVTPEYRDYKTGKYIYVYLRKYFLVKGFYKIKTESKNKYHEKYLRKMGFKEHGKNIFIKNLKE